MSDGLDIAWILLCAFLVFMMQAGFLCLETGLVRTKNSINVAIKNITDLCLSGLVFWLFGYGLMFGDSHAGWIGTDGFLFGEEASARALAVFFFQAMFCSTSATIVCGAVAERMRFLAYVFSTLMMVALIYPVTGHWAWGGVPLGEPAGWLARMGFIDFAGSTVVHAVGGWVSLAAVLRLGARQGRFEGAGFRLQGGNLPLATLGVILLWFGWFGFNGGSSHTLDAKVPMILLNTFIAAASGCVAAMLASYARHGYPAVLDLLNGVIGGLVAITASCHLQSPMMGALIGAVGGIVVVYGSLWLERLRIDDAVGAIPAHLFAGIWGTLAVALFAPDSAFVQTGGRLQQLWVQCLGSLAIGFYAFAVSFALLWLIGRFYRLRVDAESERLGLNVAEHGATTEILDLLMEMDGQRRRGDFSRPVTVEPHTEVGQIASQYNHVLQRVNQEIQRREDVLNALSASEGRKSAILDAVLDCIVTIDRDGRVLEFNPAAARTLGCSQRSAIGRDLADLMIPSEWHEAFHQALRSGFVVEGRFLLDQRTHTVLKRADGETFPAEIGITQVIGGRHPEYNLHVRDVTKQREIQRRLHQLAHFDSLTGLSNRHFFRNSLSFYLTADTSRQVAVLFLDLDRFKNVNDTLGHAAGDQLLRAVAERLRHCVRTDDLLARWGGDEFIVALLGVEGQAAVEHKADQILRELERPHRIDGRTVRAPASIGVATYPDGGDSPELLIRNADLSLYQAKKAGRNLFRVFSTDMAHLLSERLELESDLREALELGEFELFYQPQLLIDTGELIGLEALLRWRRPGRGVVMPAVFIPVLEETGLIDGVGEWVLRAACSQYVSWCKAGLRPPRIAVNVSGRQFLQTGFSESVSRILRDQDAAPTAFQLEITETVLARDTRHCIDTLRSLRALGLEIALDDFGTGYSSLSYLKRFPIDVIKLDRSFVSECHLKEEDAAICAAVISLGRTLGLKTVAEGVEESTQLEFLQREGCLACQGYLFSPPKSAHETAELLRERSCLPPRSSRCVEPVDPA
ncbi:ammonium transporter [Imhoffiella purpurea]|uniref:cyclic-guanylate-specific phosphodiesterase n=1 Tax=Imhoffiella purpurea TaxID=1249627 RepID=W9VEY9_9GAMM|nr:ammonium transporter [Imhoffiella purpurea]EXJ15556.1 Ammonium transporter [Imhoffiella purpurea]